MTNWNPKAYKQLEENMVQAGLAKRKPLEAAVIVIDSLAAIDEKLIAAMQEKMDAVGSVVLILNPKAVPSE